MTGAPPLAGFLAYVIWRPTWNFFNSRFWTKSNWSEHKRAYGNTVFSLFVNKAVDRIKNRIIRTPDPTALEFQEVFRKLMTAVSSPSRSFVFVIDYLDRISESE